MIFSGPAQGDAIDQGDIIDNCPLLSIASMEVDRPESLRTKTTLQRIIVLTQTCDLANLKVSRVLVAVLLEAQSLIDEHSLKAADVRGPIRAGRVYGWY